MYQYKRSLAARNAFQSGDVGYSLGQIDYQDSADDYVVRAVAPTSTLGGFAAPAWRNLTAVLGRLGRNREHLFPFRAVRD